MKKEKIAIIGLGYVGLPLARLFATKFPVVGFDINIDRIDIVKNDTGGDHRLELFCLLIDRPGTNQKITFQEFNDTYTETDSSYTP